jgi:hypothetical protein
MPMTLENIDTAATRVPLLFQGPIIRVRALCFYAQVSTPILQTFDSNLSTSAFSRADLSRARAVFLRLFIHYFFANI